MGWLMSALGTALAVAGTLAIASGAPYIQLEWGYSEVIAGTTALSAGIVTIGLAAILFALRGLTGVARAMPAGSGGAIVPGTDPNLADPRSPGRPKTGIAAPAVQTDGPTAPDRGSMEPASIPVVLEPDRWADHPARATGADEPGPGPNHDQEPALFRGTHDPAPSANAGPTVVGRYEASGAFYVLFSDGTIEVETETGTHRYTSMQELRDHIERQAPG